MIYVFSNRNISGDNWLGDDFNSDGNENIRVAKYQPDIDGKLEFYDEVEGEDLPSIKVIKEIETSNKPCCIFIHGFNQDLEKNLKKSLEIESYGVNVISFSWPSNPGPQQWWWKIKEYKKARQNARRSAVALERFFEKFTDYTESAGAFTNIRSLVVHSMGNYLFQSFISGLGYERHTKFLNNILLHQADVDSCGHEKWADLLAKDSRVMATINETDDTLDFSDVLNPDRLGNTLSNLNSEALLYFNFGTLGKAENKHRLWIPPTTENSTAHDLFDSVFKGKKVLTGHLAFDDKRNCFNVK